MKRNTFYSITLSILAVLLCGCGSQNAANLTESYLLEAPAPAPAEAIPLFAGVLKIRHCRAASPFDGQHFLYRTSGGQYQQDFYRQFLTPPNEQIAESLRGWMENSALFGSILPASSAIDSDYMLEPQLLAIYADFSDALNPKTVIKMHLMLIQLDQNHQESTIMLEKTYQRSETFQEKSGKSIIAGYNAGLESIFTQLVQDIRDKTK